MRLCNTYFQLQFSKGIAKKTVNYETKEDFVYKDYYLKDTVSTEVIKVKMILSATGIKIVKADGGTEVTTDYTKFQLFKKNSDPTKEAAAAADISLKTLVMMRILGKIIIMTRFGK